MRSKARDQGGYTTFSGLFDGVAAASGVGIASGGIPFTWTRNATGSYTVRFDQRLTTVAYTMNVSGGFYSAAVGGNFAGQMTVAVTDFNGVVQNGVIHFQCTARDQRT